MIHLGTWQDAAWPEQVDCIITDPPYSERTHSGNNGGRRITRDARIDPGGNLPIRQIDYSSLTPDQAHEWGREWGKRTRSWVAVLTDSELIAAWRAGFGAAGLCTFAPVPCVITGMTCRMTGDGPSSWAVYLMVARTKAAAKWGTLPGAYMEGQKKAESAGGEARIGGKPLPLMQQIVRDYSRPGMLVADPCAGHATTLVAALQAGRRVWGAECDPAAHAAAVARLERVTAQPQLITETIQPELL
jgi:site-specific DNA-methyltransferase (adenine-specific)